MIPGKERATTLDQLTLLYAGLEAALGAEISSKLLTSLSRCCYLTRIQPLVTFICLPPTYNLMRSHSSSPMRLRAERPVFSIFTKLHAHSFKT